jgi:septum formation protein
VRPAGLILASASPRRRELLAQAGYEFQVVPSHVEEPDSPVSSAPLTAIERARAKARAVAASYPGHVVLAADTLVLLKGHMLGKPVDAADARRTLRRLRGTRHAVVTGVAVRWGEVERTEAEQTVVLMKRVSDEAIDAYVATGEPMGKAGAYAVQEEGDRFIDRMEGSYTNVVGLPMELVGRMLGEMGIHPTAGPLCEPAPSAHGRRQTGEQAAEGKAPSAGPSADLSRRTAVRRGTDKGLAPSGLPPQRVSPARPP